MATATIKFVPSLSTAGSGDSGQRSSNYYGTIAFSAAADTYATGGLTTVLTPTNPLLQLGSVGAPAIFTDRTPIGAWVQSQTNSGVSYIYNTATKKLLIMLGGGAGAASVEATNAAALSTIGGGGTNVFTDVVFYWFVFPRI